MTVRAKVADEDVVRAAELRGYSRGYSAGKARGDRSVAKNDRFDLFYAAAMTGLLSCGTPWGKGDKTDRFPAEWADTAAEIAAAMIRRKS